MKTWVRKSLKVGVMSAGIILIAGGAAQAETSDNDGALTGNQILADVNLPVNLCGNAIGVLGDAEAACAIGGGAGGANGTPELTTGDNGGLGAGNQVLVPANVPINICGNAIGVLGDAAAACEIGEGGGGPSGGYDAGGRSEGAGALETGDNGGALTGNQLLADVDLPINVCGNAIAVAGDTAAACAITPGGGGDAEGLGAWNTGDNDGALTGNQIAAILDVPINVCGNAIGVLGDASAACSIGGGEGPGEEPEEPGEEPEEPGEEPEEPGEEPEEPGEEPEEPGDGTGSGYGDESRRAAESLPVFNSVSGLSQLTDLLPLARQAENAGGLETGNNSGALTGNQAVLDLDIPIAIAGNSVGVAGDAMSAVH